MAAGFFYNAEIQNRKMSTSQYFNVLTFEYFFGIKGLYIIPALRCAIVYNAFIPLFGPIVEKPIFGHPGGDQNTLQTFYLIFFSEA